jgi:hypothetical protein
MPKEVDFRAKRDRVQHSRREARTKRRFLATGVLFAAASLSGSRALQAATESWTPGGAAGGSGTWDTVTPNWNGGSTTWTNGNNGTFSGTAGTVTVASSGISLGNATFTVEGYTVTGGTLTLSAGTTPGFGIPSGTAAGTTTLSAPIAGSLGCEFLGDGVSSTSFNVSSSNSSYTGTTIISACSFYFSSVPTGSTSSIGESGTVSLGYGNSTTEAYYTGAAASTSCDFEFTGSGGGVYLNNNGTGPNGIK